VRPSALADAEVPVFETGIGNATSRRRGAISSCIPFKVVTDDQRDRRAALRPTCSRPRRWLNGASHDFGLPRMQHPDSGSFSWFLRGASGHATAPATSPMNSSRRSPAEGEHAISSRSPRGLGMLHRK